MLRKTKTCSRCKIEKPASAFNPAKANKDLLSSRCRPCNSARAKEWVEQNPEKAKFSAKKGHLRRTYGISIKGYNEMIDAQKGGCAICHSPLVEKHTCVDHDHETNNVRGILCRHCNSGLGQFKDQPLIIEAALGYLARTKGR